MSMPSRFEHTLGADLGGSKLLLCYRDQRQTLPTGPGFDAAELRAGARPAPAPPGSRDSGPAG